MKNVWSLISKYWNVPPPQLVISVTGGARTFNLKNRLKHHFKRGLINAATTTGFSFFLFIVLKPKWREN
jgi:transient receptor potential cation channel subfamily M protein 2